jgi:aryl-alcohol dehydrogenase-like predicted oxidoreductase
VNARLVPEQEQVQAGHRPKYLRIAVEGLGARPPLEHIDLRRIHRIGRDREVETSGGLAGQGHSSGTCDHMRVSVRWSENEVTGGYEHPLIVPTNRYP